MKKVSLEIAKVLKDAGYPLTYNEVEYEEPWGGINSYIDYNNPNLPTYIDVWLWLWREKKYPIDIDCYNAAHWSTDIVSGEFTDPEEAIITAIDYLVENNMIK